ncbi:TPA: Holliday junction branch migration protein RuvA [Patescibacteria group bacterium]|uniref:Holliday junction branch migration complex subunit RuvA n=1 Tax=Candidatus Gottesmanbacteria bacterium GW2011_GWA1_43_11 TaxID=1618436 RepID=A0A0G1FEY1_9BACT|nr:MAG: Holliday junction ATP-dependent DNA helicase RuvA [Candidatus Gottesmanbacteria bacterium GW2011_GWA1_43_11]HCS79069.1 Holliday junction branch migration protein RuvA [Patescibacteria group bacterium]
MIAALSGVVLQKRHDSFLIMTDTVGYLVHVGPQLLTQIPLKEKIFIYTYTYVREDMLQLFGFRELPELQLFEMLLSVSGIGPKTALAIADRGVAEVKQAIVSGSSDFFTTVPRVGRKNAQKIIIELRSKMGAVSDDSILETDSENADLVTALMNLGFEKAEITQVIEQTPAHLVQIEDKLKFVLKQLRHTSS